ncbi:GNAT family N-acetyltransferase [Paenibacillus sp. MMS20-IR301]|uniref:GNAT family N-acetyltransferase n=1 Tax=Paenibacillus sp. MMS20-IR301 TaxID=2895946 RepID=UPI0028E70FAA|nr:GNAT family N-acetyltransferase [Paenibacillus sp. MMS20-IR301]WNS44959.1 GNAT family N-acetyltransferase [Paenibacillus sp. MMS20-IR301]
MIRKLNEADRAPLMTLLQQNPAINLYIIGDVENFGMEQPFMELWGETDEPGGPVKAVMMRYYGSYICYADGPFDVEGFAELLSAADNADMLSGSTEVVGQFSKIISFSTEKHMYFAELKSLNERIYAAASPPGEFQTAAPQDVEDICSLTDQIVEFSGSSADSRQSLHTTLETGTGRTYFMTKNGQTAVTASTAAENSMSAMVIAVATHPDYRGQGLATRVVARLCADVLAEGKSLCLFYNNPKAGLIYKKLGFSDIGTWSMLYL